MNSFRHDNDKSKEIKDGWIKCSLCGCEFDEKRAQQSCKGCPIMKGCRLIKCPNCGFEMPPSPKWLKEIVKRRRDSDEVK